VAEKLQRAQWGAQAHTGKVGKLPTAFPRPIGPNAMKYLQDLVESGLTCDMTGRFEKAFADLPARQEPRPPATALALEGPTERTGFSGALCF